MKKIISTILAGTMLVSALAVSGISASAKVNTKGPSTSIQVKEQNKVTVANNSKRVVSYDKNGKMSTWFSYKCGKNVSWKPSKNYSKKVLSVKNDTKKNRVYVTFNKKVKDNSYYQIKAISEHKNVFHINLMHYSDKAISNVKVEKNSKTKLFKATYNVKKGYSSSICTFYCSKDKHTYTSLTLPKLNPTVAQTYEYLSFNKVNRVKIVAVKKYRGIIHYSKPVYKKI